MPVMCQYILWVIGAIALVSVTFYVVFLMTEKPNVPTPETVTPSKENVTLSSKLKMVGQWAITTDDNGCTAVARSVSVFDLPIMQGRKRIVS